MKLQQLSSEHLNQLLAFEIANRAWFDKHIAARPAEFYSLTGVAEHIEDLLQAFRNGSAYPAVIEQGDELLARVNLRVCADGRSMSLGYRVAHRHIGHGVASFGVAELLRRTHLFPQVTSVVAMVSLDNHASQRVLEKNGFQRMRKHVGHARVGGRLVDCWEYQRPWP